MDQLADYTGLGNVQVQLSDPRFQISHNIRKEINISDSNLITWNSFNRRHKGSMYSSLSLLKLTLQLPIKWFMLSAAWNKLPNVYKLWSNISKYSNTEVRNTNQHLSPNRIDSRILALDQINLTAQYIKKKIIITFYTMAC